MPLFALLSIRSKGEESVRRLDNNASMHIDLCEIYDIVEEIDRVPCWQRRYPWDIATGALVDPGEERVCRAYPARRRQHAESSVA